MSTIPVTTTVKRVEEEEADAKVSVSAALEYDHLQDLDLPPLRIHATSRTRLSASSLNIPPGIQNQISQKRFSLDSASPTGVGSIASSIASRRCRSRSRSPSIRRDRTLDGNSSVSSLEDFVDSDILYDKMGFGDMDMNNKDGSKAKHNGSYIFGDGSSTRLINLTPVSERMSEDTLEDVHAFSDLSVNTNTRPSSSVGTGGSTVGGEVSSHVLEPLDEGDEDLESDDDVEADERQPSQVIVTNLENISLDKE